MRSWLPKTSHGPCVGMKWRNRCLSYSMDTHRRLFICQLIYLGDQLTERNASTGMARMARMARMVYNDRDLGKKGNRKKGEKEERIRTYQ